MSMIIRFSDEQEKRLKGLSIFGDPKEVIPKALGVLDILAKSIAENPDSKLAIIINDKIEKVITGL